MTNFLCLMRQTKNHVMILASVISGTEQFCLLQKFLCKYGEMTDIIVRTQIILRIIRLKMKNNDIVNVR